MKLRRPCEHGRYEEHNKATSDWPYHFICPGGVFLPDDTLEVGQDDWDDLWHSLHVLTEKAKVDQPILPASEEFRRVLNAARSYLDASLRPGSRMRYLPDLSFIEVLGRYLLTIAGFIVSIGLIIGLMGALHGRD